MNSDPENDPEAAQDGPVTPGLVEVPVRYEGAAWMTPEAAHGWDDRLWHPR